MRLGWRLRARMRSRASAEGVAELVPAEPEQEAVSGGDGPLLTPEQELRLEEALTALAARLEALGAEPPQEWGPGTVAIRVMGRERGRRAALPLPGIRVRLGWKQRQVEAITDITGWAIAALPLELKRGAYRVSILKKDGKVLASRRAVVSSSRTLPVHHFNLRARPVLRESFERGKQWREAIARAALQVGEFLQQLQA
jgi:hypothetical protein